MSLAEKRRVREFYAGDYHRHAEYTSRHPWHVAIAGHRARLLHEVFPEPGKVLDAGCAGGEEVLELRAGGVDAWGFDICPDLHDVAYPEVLPFVRMGRFDRMPFSRADGFRTLVSHDVFEHVPIDELQRLPAELVRLGITQVSCIISNDTESAGHITIQDTAWYVELFAQAGLRLMTELQDRLAEVYAPVKWVEPQRVLFWAPYFCTGRPRNAWNGVPGHLFFCRDQGPASSSSSRWSSPPAA